MDQKEIFKTVEGNNYHQRNVEIIKNKTLDNDIIVQLFEKFNFHSKKVLEVGCSNGYRLAHLQKKYNIEAYGIEPSNEAIETGKNNFSKVNLIQGTADELPFADKSFDVIIYGFCLYLCDRADLFKIAFEADRVLRNDGFIIIYDFYPPFPYKKEYSHLEGIHSYKIKYDEMFTWNPSYTNIFQQVLNHNLSEDVSNPDDRVGLSIIRKNIINDYPVSPFDKK